MTVNADLAQQQTYTKPMTVDMKKSFKKSKVKGDSIPVVVCML